jgi:hypothetical protein
VHTKQSYPTAVAHLPHRVVLRRRNVECQVGVHPDPAACYALPPP